MDLNKLGEFMELQKVAVHLRAEGPWEIPTEERTEELLCAACAFVRRPAERIVLDRAEHPQGLCLDCSLLFELRDRAGLEAKLDQDARQEQETREPDDGVARVEVRTQDIADDLWHVFVTDTPRVENEE